jgi:hypothetical protein
MVPLLASDLAVLSWCVVTAIVGMARPLPGRQRATVLAGALAIGAGVAGVAAIPRSPVADVLRVLAPALWVLGAYWTASGFFVAPDPALERWLLRVDQRLLGVTTEAPSAASGRRWVLPMLELAYLAVYAMLPLGAWAAWATGGREAVDWYWLVVFPAEASCYLALAWLQTRPPRDLEPGAVALHARSPVRRLNEFVLQHGSHRMNTIPSGHAAGAVAVVLALTWLGATAAAPLAVVGSAILFATVLGRYHFAVDTITGVLVAVVWWLAVVAAS